MASPARPRRPASLADVEALPDHLIGEILGGDLHVSPRPSPRHAVAAVRLDRRLGPPYDDGLGGPGGWWILIEPELRLGGDVLVPDLAGWRRERLPVMPDTSYFALAPDWICEVLSPSTERLDRGRKLAAYAREGVSHAWLVNPETRTLEILRRQDDRWLLVAVHEGDAIVRAEPFPAAEIDLLAIWGETRTTEQ